MNIIPHTFKNINAVLDYIICEEDDALRKDENRTNQPIVFGCNPENPQVCYFNNFPTDAFIVNRLYSGRFNFKPNLRHRKFLFRGQNSLFNPCMPNLYRDRDKNYFIDDMIKGQELMLLMLSHPLVQLLDLGVIIGGQKYVFEMNLYGLTQHYYNKTSFLDLTSDENVAAFFAVTKYDSNSDTYSPIEDETQEGVLYYYEMDTMNNFSPFNFSFNTKLSTIGLQVFPRSGNQRGFLLELDRGINFNELPIVKIVKFKHNKELSNYYFNLYNKGKSLFPEDILTKHWSKYHQEKVVSNKSFELNVMFNPNKTRGILLDELSQNGITLQNYIPEFTKEELHEYYMDIKNGWWEEFCKNIYFQGKNGNQLKLEFVNIRNHDDYSWAFEENKSYSIEYDKGFLLKEYKKCLMD